MGEMVKSLVALCPAYNPVSYWLKSLNGLPVADALTFHPDLLSQSSLRILIELFGIELRETVHYKENSLGEKLLDLIETLEEVLENSRARRALEEGLDIKFEKTPAQDYVEMCIEALASDKISLRILQELGERGEETLGDLMSNLERKFNIRCTEREVLERLRKIRGLGLLSDLSRESR